MTLYSFSVKQAPLITAVLTVMVAAVAFSFHGKQDSGGIADDGSCKYGASLADHEDELDSLPENLRDKIVKSIKESEARVMESETSLREEFPDSALLPFKFSSRIALFDGLDNGHSVLVSNYEYTGGAHGNAHFESYNVSDGEDVPLSSIVKRPFDEVIKEIKEQLESKNGVGGYFEEGLEKYQSFDDFETWNISKKGGGKVITITFPLYTVASFSKGVQIVEFDAE